MKKAWEHFGVEEEVFKTIVNFEEEFVRSMMKKRFGVDYDGIAVKTQIKKNETLTYELAESIIKLDISFVKKVQSVGKNYKNYFQNNNADMAKKIEMVYGLKHQELIKILEDLPAPQRTAFIYSFGIDRKVMPISKVAELLKKQEEEVILLIKTTFSALERKELNNTNNTQSKENDVPNSLISPLIKKGYEKSSITKAIMSYDSDICLILRRVYGFDYSGFKAPYIKLSDEEKKIINDVISGEDNIESRIKSPETSKGSPIKLPVNLPKYCKKMGYEKDDLIDAYSNLTIEQKTLFKKAYDSSFNYIGKDLDQKDLDILKKMLCSEDFGLIPLLKKSKYERYNGGLPQNLFSQFTPRGYTKKEVILGYKRLPKDTQILVLSKYDKDFRLRKDVYISKEAKEKLKKVINEDFEKAILGIEYAYDFAVSIGFTKEEFVSVLESLPNEEEKTLRIYMSKDLILKKEISSQTIFMIQKKLPAIMYIERQKNGVSTKDIKLNEDIKQEIENLHKIKYFYDYAVSLGFTKEEFIQTYNSLTLEEKTKLETLINEDFSLKRTIKSSESAYYISHVKLPALMYLEREKNNIDTTNIQVTETVKAMIDSFRKTSHETKYLYDYAVSIGFTKEEFIKTYNSLTLKEKKKTESIINEDFSLKQNLSSSDSVRHISYIKLPALMYLEREKNNIDTTNIQVTNTVKATIDSFHKPSHQTKYLYDYAVSIGFTKEEFIKIYNLLTKEEKVKLEDFINEDFSLKKTLKASDTAFYISHIKLPALMYIEREKNNIDISGIQTTNKIKEYIDQLHKKDNKKYMYDYAVSIGFTKVEFILTYNSLTLEEKTSLKSWINEDFSLKKSINSSESAYYINHVKLPALMYLEREKNNIDTTNIQVADTVKTVIDSFRKTSHETKYLYDYAVSIGFTKEEFIEAYNLLTLEEKKKTESIINEDFSLKQSLNSSASARHISYIKLPALMYIEREKNNIDTTNIQVTVQLKEYIDKRCKKATQKYLYDYMVSLGFTKEEFFEIYEKLNDEEKNMVEMYINEDFSIKEKFQAGSSMFYMTYAKLPALMYLEREKNNINIDDLTLTKLIKKEIQKCKNKEKAKEPKHLYDIWVSAGFTKEEFIGAYNLLGTDERNQFKKYIDDDFTLKAKIPRKGSVGYLYNTKIPAIMYKIRMDKGMDVDSLKLCKSTKKIISNVRIKINKYIYDNALDCGFTKNEFLNVFKNLEDIEKDQIKEYINDDLSFKALASDENSAVYNLLEVKIPALMVIERIEKGLNTHELRLSESVKKAIEELNKHLYDYSLSIGFTKEEFIEVYNSLIEDRKNRLNAYINNNFLITHEITDEYDHNTVYVVIPALIFLKQIRACEKTLEEVMSLDNIDEKIKSLTNMMINDKKYAREFANENEKYYYDLYIKRGFTKEEFDNIYNCVLSDEERKLVHVYCDTDFKLSKTNVSSPLKEEAYKLYYQTFYVYLGLNRLENKGTLDGVKLPLRADKAIEEIRRKEKMRTVFDLLSNFNKELVKRVISSFSRDEKSLYYTYFDKKDVQIDVNLNVEIKNLIYNIIPIRIKKLIFEEKIQLETSIPTNLCDYFKNYTSRKDFIMYALLFLPHKYLEFFNYYYDEELMLKKGIKYDAEIFKLMNIVLKYKEEDLKEPIQTSSLQRILENLNEIVDLKAYFDHRGLKDKFEYAAGRIYEDKLSSVNCSIIKKHYDERFELKNDELSPKEINLLIKTLEDISLYLKKMEISDDEVMDYANSKNIKEYIEKIKSMHIFTSEMINSLSISGKALYFLSIEFIINKDSTFTLSDEAEILGISKNDLCNNLYTSIIEAKGAIEKIFNKNLKN